MQEIARRLAGFKLGGLFGSRTDVDQYNLLPSPDEYERIDREFRILEQKIKALEEENRRLKKDVVEEQKRSKVQQERARGDERKVLMKMLQSPFADFSRMLDYINGLPEAERIQELQRPVVHGVNLALSNMVQALAAAGMKRFSAKAGTEFNSEWLNPVTYEYSADVKNGLVLRTLEHGYYLKIQRGGEEKRVLLYPAQVALSLGRRE